MMIMGTTTPDAGTNSNNGGDGSSSGGGCSTSGTSEKDVPTLFFGMIGVGAVGLRRRRRASSKAA